MQELAEQVRRWVAEGHESAVARVIDIKGFSTWSGDEMAVVDRSGHQVGSLLGNPGRSALAKAVPEVLESGGRDLVSVTVSVDGRAVAEAGLACGGQAELLLQRTSSVPGAFWDLVAARSPVALVTPLAGSNTSGEAESPRAGEPGASQPAPVLTRSVVVAPDGRWWGTVGGELGTAGGEAGTVGGELGTALKEALALMASGHSVTKRLEGPGGGLLVEAWVPGPRLVVVGNGELVEAIRAQGGLLGWECRAVDHPAGVGKLLDWAGTSGALIVLSHDPHVDVDALSEGLVRGVAYVGALGSRRTQSRRLERLAAAGIEPALLQRIHRPIGLDLGGRSAAEVALAICAEVLACHCGRDARPLGEHHGPINDRPTAAA